MTPDDDKLVEKKGGHIRCYLVVAFNGALSVPAWRDALLDKFYMTALRRQILSFDEQYKIVNRAQGFFLRVIAVIINRR